MHRQPTVKRALVAAAVSLLLAAAPAGEPGGEVLANSDIIGLTRARIAPAVIVAKINSGANIFDLSSRGLMNLKENGVDDEVIAAMMAVGHIGAAPAAQGGESRFRREMENLAGPDKEQRGAGMAWMSANREQALPPLRRALTDSRPEIRAAAVRALGELRDRDSVPAIRNLVAGPDPKVRQAAAGALYALGDSQSVNAAEQALSRPVSPLDGYIRLVGHARLTRTAGALGQILAANPDPLDRAAAAWALGEIGRAATAGRPALEKALETDADADVRRESALALAKFHDPDSAALLMNACRRDPEVRKVTLEAMAEYPETVEFLISVMNLGADQIAVDELESARASLAHLTGQDFSLDGQRWSSWFAANRAHYARTLAGPSSAHPDVAPQAPMSPSRPQVDVEAWSIVADSAAIPMAPQLDGGPSARMPLPGLPPSGVPAVAGLSPPGAVDNSSIPLTLSPNEFDAVSGTLSQSPGYSPAAPQSIPAMDLTRGTTAGGAVLPIPPDLESPASPFAASPSSPFQTWSSDPERSASKEPAPAQSSRGPTGFPGRPDIQAEPEGQWRQVAAEELSGDLMADEDEFFAAPDSGDDDTADFFSAPPARTSSLPASPIVSPLPPADSGGVDDNPLRGLSLPIPGSTARAPEPAPADRSPAPLPPPAPTLHDGEEAEDFFFLLGDGAAPESSASLEPYKGDGIFYDPAAVEENLLYGDELSGMVDVDGGDWATVPEPDAQPSPFSDDASDPFAIPDGLAASPPDADDGTPTDEGDEGGYSGTSPGEAETTVQDEWILSPNIIFVEPEEGQVMVDDNWTGTADGAVRSAPPAQSAPPSRPAVPEATYVNPYGDNPANYPPPNPAYISSDPKFTPPPPREYTEPYRPPQEEPQSLPEYGDDVFTNPSTPLPPVRPEGTVMPPPGKEMPRMLGEGLFK